ncbi:CaiB/BaiF CoA transferase family protein [Sphingomonas sp. Leaf412]|uniref:CaiB/BaiF CoA transferase family protein n=1 Tax=Sphingomonas sp. Leaf412 TaxID=1736370 RepID=UPI001F1F6BB2|nr:CoA transferase [Sphingomonas sp. Leaf412]
MIDLPLTGVRVVDRTSGGIATAARLLAELGADVIRVEAPGGGADRDHGPTVAGVALSFVADNLGKRAVAPADDDPAFDALLADAHILIEDSAPGSAAQARLDPAGIAARHPALVVMSISSFGQSGPWARWQATDGVLHAVTGGLSRSGLPDRAPLLPPGELTIRTAGVQIAALALASFIQRLRDGRGDHVDVSLLEAGMAALDPGFGVAGSAQSGVPLWKMSRGRVDERFRYPIFACADGHVRLCVLAPRQWRGMFEWMGRPDEFAGPEWEKLQTRFRSTTLIPAMARFFADRTRAQIEREAEAHGVPAAALLDLGEAVATPQMVARGAVAKMAVAPGVSAPFPNGTIEIDGARAGIRGPAPDLSDARFDGPIPDWHAPPAADLPLAGLKVLDMGVIVVGAETGRFLADLGADVVKVENGAFPDGQRQSRDDAPVSITFAAGHRNKRGLSIDLKSDAGKALFARLVERADVLCSNFKPGTLAGLGFTPERLRELNPRLVTVDSAAFGPTGPWSRRLGYGPLVRASAGLAKRWTYPGEPDSFSDGVTVYPDHVAARVGIVGVLALLIRRMRTGLGGSASVSQAEVMLGHMATDIAALGAAAAGHRVDTPPMATPSGLYPAAGDDEWVVVTARDAADWRALAEATGHEEWLVDPLLADAQGRDAERARIDDALARWTAARPAGQAAAILQAAGVPAGEMLRVVELPAAPQHVALGTFREAAHPLIDVRFAVEGAPARSRLPLPDQRPAPRLGEDSAAVVADWLELTDAQVDRLLADRIIETV